MASAIVYANTIRSERPDRADEAAELAELFCKQSRAASATSSRRSGATTT
jgi:hypothetical protein